MKINRSYTFLLPESGFNLVNFNINIEGDKMYFSAILDKEFSPKDGDFIVKNNNIIIIFKSVNEDGAVISYAGALYSNNEVHHIDTNVGVGFGYISEYDRFATSEEKEMLIKGLEKIKKKWDPESKSIESVILRSKVNEDYYAIDNDMRVIKFTEKNSVFDDIKFKNGNYFIDKKEAEDFSERIRYLLKNRGI